MPANGLFLFDPLINLSCSWYLDEVQQFWFSLNMPACSKTSLIIWEWIKTLMELLIWWVGGFLADSNKSSAHEMLNTFISISPLKYSRDWLYWYLLFDWKQVEKSGICWQGSNLYTAKKRLVLNILHHHHHPYGGCCTSSRSPKRGQPPYPYTRLNIMLELLYKYK